MLANGTSSLVAQNALLAAPLARVKAAQSRSIRSFAASLTASGVAEKAEEEHGEVEEGAAGGNAVEEQEGVACGVSGRTEPITQAG